MQQKTLKIQTKQTDICYSTFMVRNKEEIMFARFILLMLTLGTLIYLLGASVFEKIIITDTIPWEILK